MPELEALTVSAPATSANLGPGFDCLAVALDLGNAVVITRRPGPLRVRVTGEGGGELAEDESNLVCRALATGLPMGDQGDSVVRSVILGDGSVHSAVKVEPGSSVEVLEVLMTTHSLGGIQAEGATPPPDR